MLCDTSVRGMQDSLPRDNVCRIASSVLPHMFSLWFDKQDLSIATSKSHLRLMHEERECLWSNHRIKVRSAVLGTGINGGYWE